MDQFALIPQHIYEQKFKLLPDFFLQKRGKTGFSLKNLTTIYKLVIAKTKISINESGINENLNSLALSDPQRTLFF